MKFTFGKKDKLKSQKLIERLFLEGKSVSAYPLRLVYLQTNFDDGSTLKTGVSVSKRNFKSAVHRNRIKRLLRESYRLNKRLYFNNITTSYALMILYIGKDKPDYDTVNTKMKTVLSSFLEKISRD
ncbi:ribonuclease P protein component [Flavobacteriaceae bacterium MAR_2010_72]|nr:ribonuclease P protein component [Flavobacteriaceae bacterium MAR_2010_72]TVZ58323.1 ribonuclease P protein component [Flavobacteriaceae bacterium MAR_2010_105]